MGFPAGLRALTHRDVRLFVTGPIGSFLMDGAAEWFGPADAYAVGGGLGPASVLGLMLVWRRGHAQANAQT